MGVRQRVRRMFLFLVFLLFPITMNYYSPYLITQAASEGVMNASFFLWTGWLITALVIGRVGCAWICPLGAAQMLREAVAPKPLVRVRHLRWIKYVLAAAWVGAVAALAISAGGYHSANLLYMTETYVSVESVRGLIMYYFILAIPLIPALFMGKQAFCHYFCPFGVLNMAGAWVGRWLRLPQLRLQAAPDQCIACKQCERACPMSLPVQEMVTRGDMTHAECILCATCADTCKQGVIKYRV